MTKAQLFKQLERVYPAKYCTDLNDFDHNIEDCKRIIGLYYKYGYKTPSQLLMRFASLSKHREAFVKKNGLGSSDSHSMFVARMQADLRDSVKHNKTSVERVASSFGIKDQNLIKELAELSIVNEARRLAHLEGTRRQRYESIVELYRSQVTLSHRTSQSMLLQQYSTPAPLGYVMGCYCNVDKFENTYRNVDMLFEPSAGNGLLTIAARAFRCVVNELDTVRNYNLKTQGYYGVYDQDASLDLRNIVREKNSGGFKAVITNPPFDSLDEPIMFGESPIKVLDHVMCIRALDCMRDDGRAALIIGGHTNWDGKGRIQAGKNRIFFSYLHRHYNVDDAINISGKLYSRQGTSFNVRMILIDGRKTKNNTDFPPLYNSASDTTVNTFDELWTRATRYFDKTTSILELEAEALALELELLNF